MIRICVSLSLWLVCLRTQQIKNHHKNIRKRSNHDSRLSSLGKSLWLTLYTDRDVCTGVVHIMYSLAVSVKGECFIRSARSSPGQENIDHPQVKTDPRHGEIIGGEKDAVRTQYLSRPTAALGPKSPILSNSPLQSRSAVGVVVTSPSLNSQGANSNRPTTISRDQSWVSRERDARSATSGLTDQEDLVSIDDWKDFDLWDSNLPETRHCRCAMNINVSDDQWMSSRRWNERGDRDADNIIDRDTCDALSALSNDSASMYSSLPHIFQDSSENSISVVGSSGGWPSPASPQHRSVINTTATVSRELIPSPLSPTVRGSNDGVDEKNSLHILTTKSPELHPTVFATKFSQSSGGTTTPITLSPSSSTTSYSFRRPNLTESQPSLQAKMKMQIADFSKLSAVVPEGIRRVELFTQDSVVDLYIEDEEVDAKDASLSQLARVNDIIQPTNNTSRGKPNFRYFNEYDDEEDEPSSSTKYSLEELFQCPEPAVKEPPCGTAQETNNEKHPPRTLAVVFRGLRANLQKRKS